MPKPSKTAPMAPMDHKSGSAVLGVETSQPYQGDFCHDHYPQPKPEINQLLLEAIEFGHDAPGRGKLRRKDTSRPVVALCTGVRLLTNERDFPYSKRVLARTASKCQD